MGDSLTFFTVPRTFEGAVAIRQTNAIRSWLVLGYPVILFGQGVEFAAQHGCISIPNIDCNVWKTPYVSGIFEQAQDKIDGLAIFINADIVLSDDALVKAVHTAAENFEKFLVIGCRTDVNLEYALDFEGDWRTALRSLPSVLHGEYGIDYLGFRSKLWLDIPPFAIGRMRWDGWLVAEAARLGAQLVDATEIVTAYHQNHGYEHVGGSLTVENPEIRINFELAGSQFLGAHHTHWILSRGGLRKR